MLLRLLVSLSLSLVIGLGTVAPGFAVDGVIEISQASIEAAGGFPLNIGEDGSYRLTSNLVVNTDVSAIRIRLPNSDNPGPKHVTLDLNGFLITGTRAGTAHGIDSRAILLTVKNGSIERFGGNGINADGTNLRAEDLVVAANLGDGIFASGAAIIRNVTSRNNSGNGVHITSGLVADSMLINNEESGLLGAPAVGFRDSILTGNGTSVNFATELGGNLCGAVPPSPCAP